MNTTDTANATAPKMSADEPNETLTDIIASHPFFRGMDKQQLRVLDELAMQKAFKTGELIFCEGDPANRFYLILDGKVVLETNADDRRVEIQTIEKGDVLGWSWLLPPYYWHFDARAVEPTKAIFFYATPLRDKAEDNHELGYQLYKRFAEVILNRLQATRRRLLKSQGSKSVA